VTGLLFALSLLPYPSTLHLKGEIESAPYINMTLATLTEFKASPIAVGGGRLLGIPGYLAQPLRSPHEIRTEGDYSGAAFLLAAGAIGREPVSVTGLSVPSAQGDMMILTLLDKFGAPIDYDEEKSTFTVSPAPLKGIQIDARQIPDLVPVLAVVAAVAEGDTEITGAARLRDKESDRLSTTAAMLRALGGEVEERADGLLIHGGKPLVGGLVNGAKDHRIVMSAAVAASVCEGEVIITDAQAADKSFPSFFKTAIQR
jgi:3-phosphoshikimate 1-carboxyvinyltransferase